MKTLRLALAVVAVSVVLGARAEVVPAAASVADSSPFYAGLDTPESLTKRSEEHLAKAREALDRLLAMKGRRTVDNTLRLYDEVGIEIDAARGPANVIANMHPDEGMRKAADAILVRARTMDADKSANRGVYDALAAVDVSHADAHTKYYVARELAAFRLDGVDKDEATRAHLNQLRTDLAAAIGEFRRNIISNTRSITVASAADLDGLPADYVARHKPGIMGGITLRADESDFVPILLFAKNEDVRRRMYMEAANVGYPENIEVLNRMMALRAEIARLLAFDSWAEYDIADRMAGSAKNASEFVDRVAAAAGPKAAREYDELLKRKRQDDPGAKVINAWDLEYYRNLVRKTNYDVDAQSVRPYFAYDRVQQGLFGVATRLYRVTFRRVNVAVWAPSVEAYEVLDGGTVLGRVYFDVHPRPNKQGTGALTYTPRSGVAGRQLAEIVMQESVPGGQPGDPGLLTHDVVRGTVFHEFGHALQHIFSGDHRWYGLNSVAERDFNEAPSQMFEEWTWDPATLATFAKHYQTNEPIPPALVARMRRANECCTALSVRGQMIYARLALSLHDRDPKTVDSTALLREITNAYVPYPHVEGTHRQAGMTHLANPGYTASYYTYMWSLVIAKDMFSQFDPNNLLAPGPARRYREIVLEPSGTKPAADMIKDFLGRPFNEKAWEKWLNRE